MYTYISEKFSIHDRSPVYRYKTKMFKRLLFALYCGVKCMFIFFFKTNTKNNIQILLTESYVLFINSVCVYCTAASAPAVKTIIVVYRPALGTYHFVVVVPTWEHNINAIFINVIFTVHII